MADSTNYKDTLNLPKTDFPMRGQLPQREPGFIEKWVKKDIHSKMVQENSEKGSFTMPDGPPYANGNLHMGHALNKVLKDIVIKYKNMAGYKAPFIPGWDCHGLPIELGVSQKLGKKRQDTSDKQLRELCRNEARSWVQKQREQFERYGILGDWENPYLTLQPEYEAEEVRVLARILKTGALYRGEKPVYWCYALQTALAEAEVEYKNHTSPSIYVKFDVSEDSKNLFKGESVSFMIWTTTPWTIPANMAISLHPDFDYEIFELNNQKVILAKGLKEHFEAATKLKLNPTGQTFKGKDLEGIVCKHPMYDRKSPIILGDHVTLEAGTGAVHTAPGHGQEDYVVGLEYDLPVYSPVDERGCYTSDVPEYEGTLVFKANPLIIERLKNSGHLLFHTEFEHSYPHCWRSKTPLLFRATPQWFLKMDLGDESIRKKALDAIKEIKWVPGWGEKRITSMIENRPDWCISRQRIWGVPIPVFYCDSCGFELANEDVMNKVADAMDTDGGIEAYHDKDASEFTKGHKCEKCKNDSFTKSKDILDVWFDSGSCFAAVQKKRDGLTFPADLYLEGSDQHRGWFHTSLLTSIASEGKAPYTSVLTHGFVMFAKGQKMSKSLGNVVDPRDIIKTNGAEILRLWAAHEDYSQDLTCSPESFQRVTETYRRFRNTMKFLLGNLFDFDVEKHAIEYENLTELDQWALCQLNILIEKTQQAYDNYEFYKIYHLLNNFFTVDLSSFYLDILKDRLYTWKTDGLERRSAQTVIRIITENLIRIMAPITSFLSEEIYEFLDVTHRKDSIFLEPMPEPKDQWRSGDLIHKYDRLLEIRSAVSKALEDLRTEKVIGSSLEAQVTIFEESENLSFLQSLNYPENFFIVSKVIIKEGSPQIRAEKATGEKCVRCWNIDPDTGKDTKFKDICPKCVTALR